MNNAAIAVMEPEFPEAVMIIEKSGIDLSEAKQYAHRFAPFMQKVQEVAARLPEFNRENPTPEMAKTARRLRLDLVANRGKDGSTGEKIALKEKILIHGRLIDGLFSVVENSSKLIEDELEEIEKFTERKEAERKSKLTSERMTLLLPFETDTKYIPLGDLTEDEFTALYNKEKEAFEAIRARREQEARDAAEAERLRIEKVESDRKIRELYSARFKEIVPLAKFVDQDSIDKLGEMTVKAYEKLKSEASKKLAAHEIEQELIRKENERLKKEAEERDAEAIKIKAEADRLANEQSAELVRIQKELQDKKDAEDLAAQKERERIESEAYEKAAREKAARLAPDKEKCRVLFESIKAISIPEFESAEGKKIAAEVSDALDILKKGLIKLSSTLL